MVIKRVECFSVRDRGRAIKGDVVRVCYRSPNQDEEADKMFYRWLGKVL